MIKKIKKILSSCTLSVQTTVLFTIIITLAIAILVMNNYFYNRKQVIDTNVKTAETVLGLEMDTISQYIRELTYFAIQPCYDSRFARIIESDGRLDENSISYIKDQMKAYYYTRSDLNSYEIYFMDKHISIGRKPGSQHIVSGSLSGLSDEEKNILDECANSSYFLAVTPSESNNDFFTFYHSIIQITDKSSLAFVKCAIDRDFLNSLIKSYSFEDGEVLLLYNADGRLLYSSDTKVIDSATPEFAHLSDSGYIEARINGKKYWAITKYDDKYGLSLVSLQPTKIITKNVLNLLWLCIIQGIALWLIFTAIFTLSIRYLMKPLDKLAAQLKKVGEGNFDIKTDLSGSLEITNLGNSFNYMSEHIDKLIRENYLVRLSEQSARLIALEAQINPHFLYNTLQAISTEALVNDQLQIHEMVISLASILRYSIKSGDFVTLAEEAEHVRKYIYLQKIRMGDNLSYNINIPDDAVTCLVPKISLQTLVENSIVHGVGGDTNSISITINTFVCDGLLHITAKDDGCGMDEDKLLSLRESFAKTMISSTQTQGVGLANLSERLKILYDNEGTIEIESLPGEGTVIYITLPIKRGIANESINN